MPTNETPGISSWTGVFVGPAAWFAAQQVAAWRVFPSCADHRPWVLTINVAALIAVVAAGWISSRAAGAGAAGTPARERVRFVVGLSVTTAAVFVFAIVLQLISGLVFTGCER